MDENHPDHMDVDAVNEGDLMRNSGRAQGLIRKLGREGSQPNAIKCRAVVDGAPKDAHYGRRPPPWKRGSTTTPPPLTPNLGTVGEETTAAATNNLALKLRAGVSNPSSNGPAAIDSFIREPYPQSAPFNAEALHFHKPKDSTSSTKDGNSLGSTRGSPDGEVTGRSLYPSSTGLGASGFYFSSSSQCSHYPRSPSRTIGNSVGRSLGRNSGGSTSGDSPDASGSGLPDCGGGVVVVPSLSQLSIRHHPPTSPPLSTFNSHLTADRSHQETLPRNNFHVHPLGPSNGASERGGHKCSRCGKMFPYASKLKDHQHIHSNDKKFTCDFRGCRGKFKRPRELKAHKKTHDKKSAQASSQPEMATVDMQRAAGVSTLQPPPPPPPPPSPPSSPSTQNSFNPQSYSASSPQSERTYSASSPEDESTLSGVNSPATTHTPDVASQEPPVPIKQVGRVLIELQDPGEGTIPAEFNNRLNRELFPRIYGE